MLFLKIDTSEPVSAYLSGEIRAALAAGKKVLWLVPGGSAMAIAVEAARELQGHPRLPNLTVSLTDERYGKPGHKNSNWQQLQKKGFLLPGSKEVSILTGDDLEVTAQKFGDFLSAAIEQSDYSLALAGMGADGHIFGIKPKSPAVESPQMVVGYKWDDYIRLTPTATLVRRLDEVVVYAVGEEKWPQLDKLGQDISPQIQPAQLLKSVKKAMVFNDYIRTMSENI